MQDRRTFEGKEIPRDGAAVVVENNREPRFGGVAVRTDQQNIERRVVGLPDGIRPISLSPMNQFERFAVSLRAVMSEGDKIRWQAANDVEDSSIARNLLPKVLRKPLNLPVQGCDWQRRLLQG
jgi:hypothetical protein